MLTNLEEHDERILRIEPQVKKLFQQFSPDIPNHLSILINRVLEIEFIIDTMTNRFKSTVGVVQGYNDLGSMHTFNMRTFGDRPELAIAAYMATDSLTMRDYADSLAHGNVDFYVPEEAKIPFVIKQMGQETVANHILFYHVHHNGGQLLQSYLERLDCPQEFYQWPE